MNKVSVVIPVYNSEKFLDESMKSILNQTLTDIEIVCVNDGSTDNSLKMLQKLKKNDSRIKIIDKPNGGCGSARNVGLENATADYVYFFDPDDYILSDALETLYNNAKKNNSDMVLSQIAWYTEGEPVDYSRPGFDFEQKWDNIDFNSYTFDYKKIKDYILNSYFAPWTKLYKTDFVKKNNFKFEENIAFDDVPFHVETIIAAERISFVPKAFYYYRTSNENSVNHTSSNAPDIIRICDLVEEILNKKGILNDFINEFYEFKIKQIVIYLISSNSDCYYRYAKNEFLRMDISDKKLSKNVNYHYNLVLNSKNYNQYRYWRNAKKVENNIPSLIKEIDQLKSMNEIYKKDNISLNNTIYKFDDEKLLLNQTIDNLNNDNIKLTNHIEDLKLEHINIKKELGIVSENLTNELNILTKKNTELSEDVKNLSDDNINLSNNMHIMKNRLDFLNEFNYNLIREKSSLEMDNNDLKNENKKLTSTILDLKQKNENKTVELQKISQINDELFASTSWKITKPFRKIMNILRKIIKNN